MFNLLYCTLNQNRKWEHQHTLPSRLYLVKNMMTRWMKLYECLYTLVTSKPNLYHVISPLEVYALDMSPQRYLLIEHHSRYDSL
ncbi:hypothetical protein HanXRQr2_Chr14g0653011 [Helianthus annuus]|uniref:Uncharacterized protein n=1 Tax=Helianthus annuus TaxID=4232 RepID=A0A251SIW0_HELAN|nr:hypothetical protein HanXRQr2_Chr14g0653011 [Helianthus annuus]